MDEYSPARHWMRAVGWTVGWLGVTAIAYVQLQDRFEFSLWTWTLFVALGFSLAWNVAQELARTKTRKALGELREVSERQVEDRDRRKKESEGVKRQLKDAESRIGALEKRLADTQEDLAETTEELGRRSPKAIKNLETAVRRLLRTDDRWVNAHDETSWRPEVVEQDKFTRAVDAYGEAILKVDSAQEALHRPWFEELNSIMREESPQMPRCLSVIRDLRQWLSSQQPVTQNERQRLERLREIAGIMTEKLLAHGGPIEGQEDHEFRSKWAELREMEGLFLHRDALVVPLRFLDQEIGIYLPYKNHESSFDSAEVDQASRQRLSSAHRETVDQINRLLALLPDGGDSPTQ